MLIFQDSLKECINQSSDLDEHRNTDLLWCVRIARSAMISGINIPNIGNNTE